MPLSVWAFLALACLACAAWFDTDNARERRDHANPPATFESVAGSLREESR